MKNLHNILLLKHLYQLKNLGYKYTEEAFKKNDKNLLALPNSMQALKQQTQNCHLCSYSKSRTQVVFGEGNKQSDIIFIGDAPLEIEDNEGKIFLGHGGEMLTSMIEKVLDFSRQNIYITNLLKCYPLASKEIDESAYHTCKAYLFKEIELIQPKIIITLGEKAYHYLTNDTSSLKEIRGTIIQKEKHIIIPTYHPSFLLKNPSFKKDVFEDLKKVRELL